MIFRSAAPTPFKSINLKLIPPSKTMTATSKETMGYKISLNNVSGSRIPVIGPAKKPRNNKITIDGNRNLQATHWALIPKIGIEAKLISVLFIVIGR